MDILQWKKFIRKEVAARYVLIYSQKAYCILYLHILWVIATVTDGRFKHTQ